MDMKNPRDMQTKEIAAEMRELLRRKEMYAYGEGEYWQHDDDRFFELSIELLKNF